MSEKKELYCVFTDISYYPYLQVVTDDLEIAKKIYNDKAILSEHAEYINKDQFTCEVIEVEKIKPREGKYLCKIIEMEIFEE